LSLNYTLILKKDNKIFEAIPSVEEIKHAMFSIDLHDSVAESDVFNISHFFQTSVIYSINYAYKFKCDKTQSKYIL